MAPKDCSPTRSSAVILSTLRIAFDDGKVVGSYVEGLTKLATTTAAREQLRALVLAALRTASNATVVLRLMGVLTALDVLPAMAGLQVCAGPSQRGLKVGRHEAYWRDHNLPVFGVVLTDPAPEHPEGGWCDARKYLRRNPDTSTIPTRSAFPGDLAQALLAACDENRSLLSALDLFDSDW